MKSPKQQKSVQITTRFQFKADSRKVCYTVRSSNGTDEYTTCLFAGKACSCTCPSRKPCYHMAQVEAVEANRTREQAESAKASTFESLKATYDVRTTSERVQNPSTIATNMVIESKRRQQAPLAGASRGFSLMK